MGGQMRSVLSMFLTSYADLSLTFMYSFQAVTSHPTVTDVNITCVTVAYGDYMTAHCMLYAYMTVRLRP